MTADPYRYFRVEARELLEQLGQGALDLEKPDAAADAIGRLLRAAHTLKGAARVVKQPRIAEHAHEIEDLLSTLRESTGAARQEQIGAVLARLDEIGALVAALNPGGTATGRPVAPAAGRPTLEPVHAFRPDAADTDAVASGIAETQSRLGTLRAHVNEAGRLRQLIELVDGQLAAGRRYAAGAPGAGAGADRLPSLVGELRTRIGALERDVSTCLDEADRELRQAGEAAARLRLIPARAVFQFLERAVRDVAQTLGKSVVFEGVGGDIRLESDVLTSVQGALLQLVRNAAAHGIEPPGERRSAGKPAEGRVTVTVARLGAMVSFVCADDGRGIDIEAVRQTLRRKGAIGAGDRRPDPPALLRLLLKGGVSTADTVSDVAGRGIGLDVVREAAERLGGEATIRTDAGQGTSVEIVVPASVASFSALLVEAAGVKASVPLDAVRAVARVTPDELVETGAGRSILYKGRSIPFSSLAAVLRPTRRDGRTDGPVPAFVIEAADGTAAFAVDRIDGTGVVVTRPLPELAPAAASVAGSSLDAGGDVRLVLDPAHLVIGADRTSLVHAEPPPVQPSVLVVDDSLTTRMLEQSILESAGYAVTVASSGEEALELARAGSYGLFLVDVEMPGIDGFEFIERVRADAALRSIPCVLVTSRASAEDRQRGREVGAQDYLVKSDFDQAVLLARIRELVR